MTTKFTDSSNREYLLTINLKALRNLKENMGLDIMNPNDWQVLMLSKGERLACIVHLIMDQIRSFDLDVDSFEEAISGKNNEGVGYATEASDSFLDELINFYHRMDEEHLAKMTTKQREAIAKATTAVMTDQFSEAIDAELRKLVPDGIQSSA